MGAFRFKSGRTQLTVLMLAVSLLPAASPPTDAQAVPQRSNGFAPKTVAVLPHDPVDGIGDSPFGVGIDSELHRAFITNFSGDSVSVVDTVSNTVVHVAAAESGVGMGPMGVAVDIARHRVLVANAEDGTVGVFDAETFAPISVISHGPLGIGAAPVGIAIDAVEDRAFVTNNGDGTVSIVDLASLTVEGVIPNDDAVGIGDGPMGLAVDLPSGQVFVANNRSGTVSVIDSSAGTVSRVLGPDDGAGIGIRPFAVAVDGLGKIYVSNSQDGTVSVIEAADVSVLSVIPHAGAAGIGRSPRGLASSGGEVFVTNRDDGTISVIDTATSKVSEVFPVGGSSENQGPTGIAWDGLNETFIVANFDAGTASVLDGRPGTVDRIGGADRWATSAAVSAATFSPGVPAAFIATGQSFADALSASSAAGRLGAPILLVSRDSVPEAIRTELHRLKPRSIVIVGGADAISAANEDFLRSVSSTVTRIGGSDRFEVSSEISRSYFSPGAKVVYVASGENFPDALSGGAAACANDAPVLLVQRDSVPFSTATELKRLAPRRIVVLGGQAAIGSEVVSALAEIAPVSRVEGVDRFATSASISVSAFGRGAETVFVASGSSFPDGLAGAAAAARTSSPILLIGRDEVPEAIMTELRRLKPTRLIVLGGPGAISERSFASLTDLVVR